MMKTQFFETTRAFVFTLLLLSFSTGGAQAGAPAGQIASFKGVPETDQLESAAQQGISRFQELAGGDRYQKVGLASAEEAHQVALGQPIRVYQLGVAELRNYRGGNAIPLLSRMAEEVVYPLEVGSEAKSSESLRWTGSQWVIFGYGGANWIRYIDPLRQDTAHRQNLDLGELFVVKVRGLGLEFLGYQTGSSQLMLIAETDFPQVNLNAGQAVVAEQLFQKLAPMAQAYNFGEDIGNSHP